jgi:hypothetical protein
MAINPDEVVDLYIKLHPNCFFGKRWEELKKETERKRSNQRLMEFHEEVNRKHQASMEALTLYQRKLLKRN